MIPYAKINYIRNEIIDDHKKNNLKLKIMKQNFKKQIESEEKFSDFCKNYSYLFSKITDDNYKKTLSKIVPIILKIHKDKNKKSNHLEKRYSKLYKNLKSGNFNTIEFLKIINALSIYYILNI